MGERTLKVMMTRAARKTIVRVHTLFFVLLWRWCKHQARPIGMHALGIHTIEHFTAPVRLFEKSDDTMREMVFHLKRKTCPSGMPMISFDNEIFVVSLCPISTYAFEQKL